MTSSFSVNAAALLKDLCKVGTFYSSDSCILYSVVVLGVGLAELGKHGLALLFSDS